MTTFIVTGYPNLQPLSISRLVTLRDLKLVSPTVWHPQWHRHQAPLNYFISLSNEILRTVVAATRLRSLAIHLSWGLINSLADLFKLIGDNKKDWTLLDQLLSGSMFPALEKVDITIFYSTDKGTPLTGLTTDNDIDGAALLPNVSLSHWVTLEVDYHFLPIGRFYHNGI